MKPFRCELYPRVHTDWALRAPTVFDEGYLTLKSFFACAAVIAALVAPSVASASTETLDFSGLGQFGPIN
ncbi:MAG TPA: hypothetical protein VNS61_02740, partial [Caldimonas sp.]|nr:hypothetical protein [Caldimonas sp.]